MLSAGGCFSAVVCLVRVSGHVDVFARPVVSVVPAVTGDPFLATIDTGFNGALMTSTGAAPSIGVRLTGVSQRVELGDGRTVLLLTGRVALLWLGGEREVDDFVSDEPSRGGEGRPVALIGAELLTPHLLLVDYGAKTVDIETRDD